MDRPTRQHAHLSEKIATKQSRSHKKPGKRTKRWKKWAEQHGAAIAAAAAPKA